MVGMLDHFKAVFPAVYRDLTYHLVEISPAMHTRQQQTLAASQHAALRGQQVHLHHASILTWPGPAAGPPARSTSTYLVATEVLVHYARRAVRACDPHGRGVADG